MTIFNVPIKSQYLKKQNKINVILFANSVNFHNMLSVDPFLKGKKILAFFCFFKFCYSTQTLRAGYLNEV